jgi:hypothetical protein
VARKPDPSQTAATTWLPLAVPATAMLPDGTTVPNPVTGVPNPVAPVNETDTPIRMSPGAPLNAAATVFTPDACPVMPYRKTPPPLVPGPPDSDEPSSVMTLPP